MKEHVAKIKSRGYWQSLIRPLVFRADRINSFTAAKSVLARLAINERGWDFPHIGARNEDIREENSIGQVIEWNEVMEAWRLSRSGQFLHVGGIFTDWDGAPYFGLIEKGRVPADVPLLSVVDSMARVTEAVEFASRYAATLAKGEGVTLTVEVGGLKGRYLVEGSPRRLGFAERLVCNGSEPFSRFAEINEGTDETSRLRIAREWARGLFERFGWEATEDVLVSFQERRNAY